MKKVAFLIIAVCAISLTSQAQTNLNREEVKEAVSADLVKQFGLTLTIDLDKGTSFVELSDIDSYYDYATTEEDKITFKYQAAKFEELGTAESFADVLNIIAGRFNVSSHQVIVRNGKEIHYFILSY